MSVLDREALFTDETELFRSPFNAKAEDVITFRFRAGKDFDGRIFLLIGGYRLGLKTVREDSAFMWLETSVRMGAEVFSYCFQILSGGETFFYSRLGLTETVPPVGTFFSVIPGFSVPDWAEGAVMYQIFPDRFCNGDPSADTLTREYFYNGRPVEHADWGSLPKTLDVGRFYGGDLQGVLKKLDHLKYLGVEVIYLNPIFLSPSNHKYDTQDYEYVDPHLTGFASDPAGDGEKDLLPEGSRDNRQAKRYLRRVLSEENLNYANAFFARFMSEVHARGMKVILDGVFNHCGSFHRFMDGEKLYNGAAGEKYPGAYLSEDSPYRSYFVFGEEGHWPDNSDYEGWWGFRTLPKLNYEGSKELEDYILRIGRKWVSAPYFVDAWRLDMAADLGHSPEYNHSFYKKFREAVKEANPEALILAEYYGDPSPWLNGFEWDSVMNYDAFMDPVSFFLTGMDKHSDLKKKELRGDSEVFFRTLRERSAVFPGKSLLAAMNQLSNHDHSRFMTRTSGQVGRLATMGPEAAGKNTSRAVFCQGVVMLFTLPGSPAVYYGDETGMVGWTDPDDRRPFPWGREDYELEALHHDMARIRSTYSCLRKGSFLPLFAEKDLLVYGRFDALSAVITAVNMKDEECEAEIRAELLNIPKEGKIRRVMLTTERTYFPGELPENIKNGRLKLRLPASSASVFGCLL